MEHIKSQNTDPLLKIFKRKMSYIKDVMFECDVMTMGTYINVVLIIDVEKVLKYYDLDKDSIDEDFANKSIYNFGFVFKFNKTKSETYKKIAEESEEFGDYFKEIAIMLMERDNEELTKKFGTKNVTVTSVKFYFDSANKY